MPDMPEPISGSFSGNQFLYEGGSITYKGGVWGAVWHWANRKDTISFNVRVKPEQGVLAAIWRALFTRVVKNMEEHTIYVSYGVLQKQAPADKIRTIGESKIGHKLPPPQMVENPELNIQTPPLGAEQPEQPRKVEQPKQPQMVEKPELNIQIPPLGAEQPEPPYVIPRSKTIQGWTKNDLQIEYKNVPKNKQFEFLVRVVVAVIVQAIETPETNKDTDTQRILQKPRSLVLGQDAAVLLLEMLKVRSALDPELKKIEDERIKGDNTHLKEIAGQCIEAEYPDKKDEDKQNRAKNVFADIIPKFLSSADILIKMKNRGFESRANTPPA